MTDARPVPTESLVSLLDQLHDIAEPPPVSMMPATWGWAILAACLLVLLAAGVWAWFRHRRRTAYRRAALAELDELAPALVGSNDTSALAVLDRLLRRTALVAFPAPRSRPSPDPTGSPSSTAPAAGSPPSRRCSPPAPTRGTSPPSTARVC